MVEPLVVIMGADTTFILHTETRLLEETHGERFTSKF